MPSLAYLDFDFSQDTEGRGCFEAMASVPQARLTALQTELAAVLGWAHASFGDPGPEEVWDYHLHGTREVSAPLDLRYRAGDAAVELHAGAGAGEVRCTLTLTLSGSPAFCDAFQQEWQPG